MARWAVVGLGLMTMFACDDSDAPQPRPTPAQAEPAQAEPTPAEPAQVPSAKPVVTAKAPAPTDPLADLLTGEPTATMHDAKAYILDHKARIGVYLGLPERWRYDDPSYLSITPRNTDDPGRLSVVRLRQSGLGEANLAQLLERGPLPTQIRKATWGSWRDGRAGTMSWPAKLARGESLPIVKSHGALATLAVVIDVPDTPAVGIMAAWPKAQPQMEQTMVDIVRHLHRCKVRVGHGCVADPK